MAYSAREEITKRVQASGSEVAYDERTVTTILDKVFDLIAKNPPLTAKDAVNLCFAD